MKERFLVLVGDHESTRTVGSEVDPAWTVKGKAVFPFIAKVTYQMRIQLQGTCRLTPAAPCAIIAYRYRVLKHGS